MSETGSNSVDQQNIPTFIKVFDGCGTIIDKAWNAVVPGLVDITLFKLIDSKPRALFVKFAGEKKYWDSAISILTVGASLINKELPVMPDNISDGLLVYGIVRGMSAVYSAYQERILSEPAADNGLAEN